MNQNLSIPFTHQNRDGIIKIEYQQNLGPMESGLETIQGINFAFDLDLCKLYPTFLASIEKYEGTVFVVPWHGFSLSIQGIGLRVRMNQ